jgi:hypothetical protein
VPPYLKGLDTEEFGFESRLWFAKMSSHARTLRISNIHADVYEREVHEEQGM